MFAAKGTPSSMAGSNFHFATAALAAMSNGLPPLFRISILATLPVGSISIRRSTSAASARPSG